MQQTMHKVEAVRGFFNKMIATQKKNQIVTLSYSPAGLRQLLRLLVESRDPNPTVPWLRLGSGRLH